MYCMFIIGIHFYTKTLLSPVLPMKTIHCGDHIPGTDRLTCLNGIIEISSLHYTCIFNSNIVISSNEQKSFLLMKCEHTLYVQPN